MQILFAHEFVAGGGLAGKPLPSTLLAQGLSMIKALLADLVRVPGRRIVTTIDARLSLELPRQIDVVPVAPGAYGATFRQLAAAARDVWIVAPETADCLATLTRHAIDLGARVVGADPQAVRRASDKLGVSRRLAEAGLQAPMTWPSDELATAVREAGFPLVVKPRLGAGCEGVGLARNWEELDDLLGRATAAGATGLLQEYIEGTPASASILCSAGEARPLSLNRQLVHANRSFSYSGGCVPLSHAQGAAACALACRACELIPGLAGYVGVDLILSARGPFVIEINPRLTMSYLGLRAVTRVNIAEIILDGVGHGRLPDGLRFERVAQFSASGHVEATRA